MTAEAAVADGTGSVLLTMDGRVVRLLLPPTPACPAVGCRVKGEAVDPASLAIVSREARDRQENCLSVRLLTDGRLALLTLTATS